ncbi:hypothetical protein MUP50_00540, partial [Patescibacteria group bacterium]|nr:hypothetical protein [Patescibacteria group bacterium]
NFSEKPCQLCRNCQDIQKGIYPDFILVEPDPLHKEIQISQIRNLIGKLSLRSYSADFKTAILDKAHLMSQEAQSCFLKFLEEPKGKTLLILITEYPQLLFPTILSRVQKLRFFPAKDFEFKIKEEFISDLIEISQSDLADRFQYAKKISTENLKEILDTWLSYFRYIFLFRLRQGCGGQAHPTEKEKTNAFNQYSLFKLKDIIRLIQTTDFLISTTNVNPKLALENLLIQM